MRLLPEKNSGCCLEPHPEIVVVGEAFSPREAAKLIHAERPELVFLDVNLRGGSGLDLLGGLEEPHPAVIFTTAYSDFARQAFDFDAVDYLVKPIRPERLAHSLRKLHAAREALVFSAEQPKLTAETRIFLRNSEKSWYVTLGEIPLIESEGNHSRVYLPDGVALIHRSLTAVEERLPAELFFRANRAQLINLVHIESIEPWFSQTLKAMLRNGRSVEFSRRSSHIFRESRSL
jgi:two-component system LytT family response regulator